MSSIVLTPINSCTSSCGMGCLQVGELSSHGGHGLEVTQCRAPLLNSVGEVGLGVKLVYSAVPA